MTLRRGELFNALRWYWTEIQADTRTTCADTATSWMDLALDFQAATHLPLAPEGTADPEGKTMKGRVRLFARASRTMAKAHKFPLTIHGPTDTQLVTTLKSLGMTRTYGFMQRFRLLRKETVDAALFHAAVDIDQGELTGTLDWRPNFDRLPPPLYKQGGEHVITMPRKKRSCKAISAAAEG